MSKACLIKLRPLDYYFFGGEETFNNGAKGLTNYLVKSNTLPQQTGLLGLMRHALYGSKFKIGSSFTPGNFDFGVIESLSPVFIVNPAGEFLFPAPVNINPLGQVISVSFKKSARSFFDGRWKDGAPETANYSAKDGLEIFWVNMASGEVLKNNAIFKKKMHIGIDKRKRNINNDEAFYKQEFVTLTEGYSFGFIAELDEEVAPADIPSTMPFGGEMRTFRITADMVQQDWETVKIKAAGAVKKAFPENARCITLLSDAYVEELAALNQLVDFLITEEKPFRNIVTPAAVKQFARLSIETEQDKGGENIPFTGNSLIKRNKVIYMLKRGSVLFVNPDNKNRVENLLCNKAFEKIGYNQFITNF